MVEMFLSVVFAKNNRIVSKKVVVFTYDTPLNINISCNNVTHFFTILLAYTNKNEKGKDELFQESNPVQFWD